MTAIAIFVKTPGLSPVKTRLAEHLGPEHAIALYRQCATAALEAARAAAIGPVYWALAESGPAARATWPGADGCLLQGDGGLGERMCRVMDRLIQRHGSGLLLGADAPQIEATGLQHAARWLAGTDKRHVIGPARDGGFWTFGSNHTVPMQRWTRVAYSRPDTLQQFCQSMGSKAAWLKLPTLTDLDTAADLAAVASELEQLHPPLPTQKNLLKAMASSACEPFPTDAETLNPEP